MEAALIIKLVSLGADMLTNGYKAYEANKAAFTSEDAAVIEQALAAIIAMNDAKEAAALDALDAASKT